MSTRPSAERLKYLDHYLRNNPVMREFGELFAEIDALRAEKSALTRENRIAPVLDIHFPKPAFPEHKCGLYLEHNRHKDVYQTAKQAIEEMEGREQLDADDWAFEGAREICIETDELWSLQWYPNTPIGFCIVYGPTLESVLKKANEP